VQGLKVAVGRFIAEQDVEQDSLVCVLGHRVALGMGGKGQLGQMLRMGNVLCHIVGVLAHFDKKAGKNAAISPRDFDNVIFIPLENRASGNLPVPVTELIVKIRSADAVMPALPSVRRVMQLMHNGVDDYQLVVPQQLLKQAEQTQLTFDFVLWSISTIGFLIGGLGIMNIMLANVLERTREIGIRRALGAKRGDILVQFLVEALVLTLTGGLLGVALGLAGAWAISGFADWELVMSPLVLFLSFLMPLVTGLFFGLYPALRAANMDPIIALRRE
jgi:putative ABC transport system permease protein